MSRGIGGTGRPDGRHESRGKNHRRRHAAERTAREDRRHPPHNRKKGEKEPQSGRRISGGAVQ